MYRRRESGFEALILFWLIVLGLALLILVSVLATEIRKASLFDNNFQTENIVIESNKIDFGQTGHPALTKYTDFVPPMGGLDVKPRLLKVSSCKSVEIEKDVKSLWAATRFPQPDLVSIQMPLKATGNVNICVPDGSEVEVILWAEK